MKTPSVVIGIDVGGHRKGFHAVALRDGVYLSKVTAPNPQSMALWCYERNARAIGIDAPCRWSTTGRSRCAERELAAKHVHAFATPDRHTAENRDFYRWMLNGAELYSLLESRYTLFDGRNATSAPICFETFPHAVACALAGTIVSAKQKRIVRRELLREAQIDVTPLTNIDMVDAALCALAADRLLTGDFKTYGDAKDGFIVVPG